MQEKIHQLQHFHALKSPLTCKKKLFLFGKSKARAFPVRTLYTDFFFFFFFFLIFAIGNHVQELKEQ